MVNWPRGCWPNSPEYPSTRSNIINDDGRRSNYYLRTKWWITTPYLKLTNHPVLTKSKKRKYKMVTHELSWCRNGVDASWLMILFFVELFESVQFDSLKNGIGRPTPPTYCSMTEWVFHGNRHLSISPLLGIADWHWNGIQTRILMSKNWRPRNSKKSRKLTRSFPMVSCTFQFHAARSKIVIF